MTINNKDKKLTAIEKSLHILSIFSMEKPALTLKEICEYVKFNPSTTYRILHTLAEYGYVVRAPDKSYCIGTQPLFLSAIYKNTNHLTQIRPVVDKIRDLSDETASFFIEEYNDRICLYRANSRDEIIHNIEQGTRLELNRGASGRIILAYGQRKHDTSGFFKDIRDKGYHVSVSEHNHSLFSISRPIISKSKRFVGALTVSGPISRFNEKQKKYLLDLLKEQIKFISIP